jgi:predicted dehydrogenase
MTNKLKAAVIGLGVGHRHADIYKSNKNVELVALCDFNKKKLNLYRKKFKNCKFTTNADEIFKDPNINIVSIASYDNFHFNHILKAIKYKKNFFVEKPFCLNFFELNKICLELRKKRNFSFSSNLILRNHPIFLDLKKRITNNTLGKIYYCEGDYNYGRIKKVLNGWRSNIPFYSVTLGGGIHLIDLIIWLTKSKVVSVVAEGNKIATKDTKFKYFDLVSVLLKFSNGIVAKVTSNFASVTPHHHILNIYGTKSSFFYNNEKAKYYKSRSDMNLEKINKKYLKSQKSELLKSFIDNIFYKKKKAIVSERQIIDLMSVCLAIEKSLKTRRREKVKYANFKINYKTNSSK